MFLCLKVCSFVQQFRATVISWNSILCLYLCYKNAYFILQICITKIKRDPNKDFKTSKHTKVCSAHFSDEDFISLHSQKRRLENDALPSARTKEVKTRSFPDKLAKNKQQEELMKQEEMATASEGEGTFEVTDKEGIVSRSVQVDIPLPCNRRLSLQLLRDQCNTQKNDSNDCNVLQTQLCKNTANC